MTKLLSAAMFFVLCCTIQLQAQTQDQWIKAGDKAFTTGDYYASYKYYGIALEYDSSRTDLWYQYAESAREFDAYRSAEKAYTAVLNGENSTSYPMALFHLARVKHRISKYDEALDLYERFLEDNPEINADTKKLTQEGIKDVLWAKEVMANAEDTEFVNLGSNVNSAYSDFGATIMGDMIYFSSLRYTYEKDTVNPPRTFVQLMSTQQIGGSAQPANVLPFSEKLNKKGKHVGHSAFNADNSKVYYTICEYKNMTDVRCDLFRSNISTGGSWSKPEALHFNGKEFTSTQPFVAADLVSGKEVLYFASDREGGIGGMDIWYSEIMENGDLGDPMNLGTAINTPKDEVTPSWYAPSRTLYFSSTGYQTLGDFDVYQSRKISGGWAKPEHLGVPVNSSYSDIYYLRSPDGKDAYFSSKRQVANAIYWTEEQETCCHDIYRSAVDVLELLALTYNKLDNSELVGTTVELIEIDADGIERVIGVVSNFDGNDFLFPLERGKKYRISAAKEDHKGDIAFIDTNDPQWEGKDRIEQKLYLEPGVMLDVLTFMEIDSSELAGATVSLYEVGPNGEETLVSSLDNLSNNDFTFMLARDKKYIIRGDRPGFYPAESEVDLADPALAGISRIERRLYFPQELQLLAFDADKNTPLNNVTIQLFEITPEGDEIRIDSITNKVDNSFRFVPLNLSKKYRVVASRPGYIGAEETYTFTPQEIEESGGIIIRKLELNRKSPWDFLPLALYFDNDHPDPRSIRRTTNKQYVQTNESYYEKRDEFIKQFTEGMDEQTKFVTTERFLGFFDRDVLGGRLELLAFSEELLAYLEDGNSIVITLKGYASPRATTAYNRILSMRRISSVKNHFNSYSDGALRPFLQSGQLKIQEDALGESTADLSQVSQDLQDPRESVYSVSASLERRVEITNINIDEKTAAKDDD